MAKLGGNHRERKKKFHRELNPGFGFSDFKPGMGSSQKMQLIFNPSYALGSACT